MTADAVFLDTFALIALAARSDAWHGRAKAIQTELTSSRTPLVTSDWVLAEFLNFSAPAALRAPACRVVKRLCSSARTTVLAATHEDWTSAFAFYEERPDKGWSFTDCSSILLCQSKSIRRVFTHDRHFAQAGFEILLP